MKNLSILFALLSVFGLSGCAVVSPDGRGPGEQRLEIRCELGKEATIGTVPDIANNAFTVAMRVRMVEQGPPVPKTVANSGMLFSVGSGYWDGMKAWYVWSSQSLTFELGRQTERNSVAVRATGVCPGLLHDLVFSYDGKVQRLHVDGELAAEKEQNVQLFLQSQPELKVGYGDYGIGYHRILVGDVVYLPRAIAQREVDARYAGFPKASTWPGLPSSSPCSTGRSSA